MTIDRIAVIGAGRVGLTLARALVRSGRSVAVLDRRDAGALPPLRATDLPWEPVIAPADLILIAVPDDAIGSVALALAQGGAVAERHVVLHTSGLQDRSALAALEASGAALGSWHPLQTFTRREGEPGALAGSPAVIEGDPRALSAGQALAELLQLTPVVEISGDHKARYHAAAVFVSSYLVVLDAVAIRLAAEAGIGAADTLFLPMMRRVVANLGEGPAAALTGPIARGDTGTVMRHLAVLHGTERALYLALGREALRLAREAGLDAATAHTMEQVLA